MRNACKGLLAWLVVAAAASTAGGPRHHAPVGGDSVAPAGGSAILGRATARPVRFEPNVGQFDGRARFVARGGGQTVFLTSHGFVTSVALPDAAPDLAAPRRGRPQPKARPRASVAATFVGACADPRIVAGDRLPGHSSYFLGDDPARWHRGVPHHAGVRYEDAWPGVDVVFRGADGRLEYDFVVAPGADPESIELAFQDADAIEISECGDLVLRVAGTTLLHRRPVLYQDVGGARTPVPGGFELRGDDRVRFRVGQYQRSVPLVIDPRIEFATYLGGTTNGAEDFPMSIAVDGSGNVHVAGYTESTDFPTTQGAPQAAFGGGGLDVFISKIDAAGANVLYSTYLGGTASDVGWAVFVDSAGNAYVGGETSSGNFPRVSSINASARSGDAFVAKLGPAGTSLTYSTLFGGSGNESGYALTVDANGNAYAAGVTTSSDLPTSAGAVQATRPVDPSLGDDGFVAKVAANGAALAYMTYLGGNGDDLRQSCGIAVDADGNAYVVGQTSSSNFPTAPPSGALQPVYGGGQDDAFASKLNADGTALVYSTYLGGPLQDWGVACALDAQRALHLVGLFDSTGMPTTPGAFQAQGRGGGDLYVAKLDAAGTALAYATYVAGAQAEVPGGIAVDSSGSIWLAAVTNSDDLPVVDAVQATRAGATDAFVGKLNAAGSAFAFASYLGGTQVEGFLNYGTPLVVDAGGSTAWVAVNTTSSGIATSGAADTTFAGQTDALVAKISLGGGPVVPVPIESYFLPKKVSVRPNAKNAAKSLLTAKGIYDTGPDAVDFTAPATLDIGALRIAVPGLTPAPDGRSFVHTEPGILFQVFPAKTGSSKARFRMRLQRDLAGLVGVTGPLDLHFANADVDGGGVVTLGAGKYSLGHVRGALLEPNLYLVRSRAKVKGGGADSFALVAGLATQGVTPPAASDVTVGLGGSFSATVPAASFTRKGDKYVFKGSAGGITKVVLDYVRETIAVSAKGVDLGAFAAGSQPVLVAIAVGTDGRAVRLRMVRSRTSLRY